MNNSKEIPRKQTTSHKDYFQDGRLEAKDNGKVPSILSAFDNRRNGENVYANNLMEKILARDNMNQAYKQVVRNKGKHGIDGMTVDELLPYLKENGNQLRKDILQGKYRPKSVRRAEISKSDRGVRLLGIPTVTDRMIQQAIAQQLTPIFELKFSDNSYGFRPNRNAHQAIKKAQQYINRGYTWVVDIDLEKYFDTVNHDKLNSAYSQRSKRQKSIETNKSIPEFRGND